MTADIAAALERIHELWKRATSGVAGYEAVRDELGTIIRPGTRVELLQDIACVVLAAFDSTSWEIFEPKEGDPRIVFTEGGL